MKSKTKMLCAFTVLLFIGSLTIGSVSASYTLAGTVNNEQLIPAETYGDDRRNEAVSILIYTEFTDLNPGQEWDNTMSSMIGSLEGRFTYDNLTDYTQLGASIEEYDILLITEMEDGNYTDANMIVAVWDSILPSFVENGGIVICLPFNSGGATLGTAAQILNGTGLMELYNPAIAYPHQWNLIDANDALARNLPTDWLSSSGSVSFDTTDGVVVVEDDTDSKAVVVHKTMGKGHVVLLGFDMYTTGNAAQDTLLQNAVLLHRHVVFDNSHAQDYDIAAGFTTISDDLPYFGFSVSSTDVFDPAVFGACEIIVITYCNTAYNATEISIIQDFVNAGGALLIVTERVGFGNATDPLMESFGFARNTTNDLEDSDDSGTNPWYIHFMPKNIQMHSTKVGVDVVEVYGSTGLVEMPVGAVPLITTDTDGTATWDGAEEAINVPVAAANLVGAGRIIILCDNGFMSDDDFDSDATINYFDEDNEIFTRNAFRWLAGAGIPEQTVVFDQSHNPFTYVHSDYNQFANLLMFNGYNVEFMSTFDPLSFEDADILFITDGSTDYNTTEIASIKSYVQDGGSLLLLGDHGSLCAQIDPIAQEFGLEINTTGYLIDDEVLVGDSYIVYDGNNIGTHPIMDGVHRIEINRGNGFISIGAGTPLVITDIDGTTNWSDGSPASNVPVFAATQYNMGRIVYLTDINFPTENDGDGDGFGLLYDSDNPIFLANVFTWLVENRAPTVEVITPNGGELLNGSITIEWDALDFDSDPLIFDVFYSDNNGSDWTILANDLAVLEFEWNTTLHDDGTGYMIRVEVSDGVLAGQDESDNPFELDNLVEVGPGLPLDPTLLLIIGAAVLVVVIIIVIIMKKKK